MDKIWRVVIVMLVMLGLVAPASGSAQAALPPTFTIYPGQPVASVSPLLLGSNAPSWLGDSYSNSTLRARTKYSGLKYLRIPGGSYGDLYGWLNCEQGTFNSNIGYQCGVQSENWNTWITRPTDYINFLRATNQKAIYILNVNSTAQEDAALVAFFNGSPTDTTTIGVDRNGQDWKTVGYWAQLRVDHGNTNPLYIKYWDFGNEDFGGMPSTGGSACQSWGWENSWTCDGAAYVNGDANHDGYLAVRAAIQAVDSTVMLGAVGVENPTDYNNWDIKVVQNAGAVMDYFIVHPYTYGAPPTSWATILASPRQTWPALKSTMQTLFINYAGGRNIPVAADEFNLTYDHSLDTKKMMTKAGNMLFVSESIGQAIRNGYFMFDQWALSNGCSASCYDMLMADNNFARSPQYYAFTLWSRFGGTMLKIGSNVATSQLSAYAGRVNSSTYTLLVINKTGQTISAAVNFSDARTVSGGTVNVVRATSLDSTSVIYNNLTSIPNNLPGIAPLSLPVNAGKVQYGFPPYSITLLRMTTP